MNDQEFADALLGLQETLDQVLRIRYRDSPGRRERLAAGYLRHELERIEATVPDEAHWQSLRARALLHACQDVVPSLVARHCMDPADLLQREEMALYVLDRLQEDGLRRLRAFDAAKGASFRTYLSRVAGNLAIDFLRRRRREGEVLDRHQALDLHGAVASEQPESAQNDQPVAASLEQRDLEQVIAGILSADGEASADDTDLRQRLRAQLRLSSKERLFLRAIYFNDLSAGQAGALPGMAMNKNQANSLHRRLLDRLADAFKQAGAYGELQGLVSELEQTLAILIDGIDTRVAVARLMLVQKRAATLCDCRFESREQARQGAIRRDYSGLRRRLYELMTDIRSDAMAADAYLERLEERSRRLQLRLLEESIEVQPRYLKRLREVLKANSATL